MEAQFVTDAHRDL